MDSRYYQNLARSQWEASVSVENPMLREHLKSEAKLNDLAAERAKTIESHRSNANTEKQKKPSRDYSNAGRLQVVDGPAREPWQISSADLPRRVDRDLEARRQVVVDGPARNSWEISSADLPQRANAERDWTAKPPISDADVINYERQIGVPKGMRFEDMENMSEEDYKKAEEKRRKWDEKQEKKKKIPKLSSDQKKKMDQTSKELLETYDPMQSLMDSITADPLGMKNRKDPNAAAGGSVKFFTDSEGRVRPMK